MKSTSVLFSLCSFTALCGVAYITLGGSSYGSPTMVRAGAPTTGQSNMIRPVVTTDKESSPITYAGTFSRDYKLSGPYQSQNLQIYLLSGANKVEKWPFLTVHDAIEQKKAEIAETGDVNQLSITNKSDQLVFIHSGDILKGGKQDRMSQYDAMIPPRQTMSLAAFCVEHDRWTQRGAESSDKFAVPMAATLPSYFPSKIKNSPALQGGTNGTVGPMISAARLSGDQYAVWDTVSKAQGYLGASTGASVQDARSNSSFELTLEGPAMQKARLPYIDPLSDLPEKTSNSVGYIAFVDGKYVAGDSYISHELFQKMWPKMLCVRATDAIVATKQPLTASGTNPGSLLSAKARNTAVNSCTTQVARTVGKLALFDTLDTQVQKSVHVCIARR